MSTGGELADASPALERDVSGSKSPADGPPPMVIPPRRATVAVPAVAVRTDSENSDDAGGGQYGTNRRPSAPVPRVTVSSEFTRRPNSMPTQKLGKNRTGSGGSAGNYPPTDYSDPQLATRTLMVYRFPREAQEVDLACRFGAFGPIEHVKVVYDPVTHLPRCYGFVRFCYRDSCVMALRACEEGKIMMDDPFGRTWHFEAKWARNARAAGEIDRNGSEKEPQQPLPIPPEDTNEARRNPLLPCPTGNGNEHSSSEEAPARTPTGGAHGPTTGATPGPPDPFAGLSDADLALINAATSPVVSSQELIGEVPHSAGENSVQALTAKALEEADNLATSSAAAAAAAAALGSNTSHAELAKLIETVFRAVRSSALSHLTGGSLGQSGGTPPSQNATAMHDFLTSIIDETPGDTAPAQEVSRRSSGS